MGSSTFWTFAAFVVGGCCTAFGFVALFLAAYYVGRKGPCG